MERGTWVDAGALVQAVVEGEQDLGVQGGVAELVGGEGAAAPV